MSNFSLEDLKNLKNLNKDDLLHAAGLQRTASFTDTLLPALAIFGAGLITGLGAGLLLAPNSGEDSRKKIAQKASEATDAATDAATHAGEELVDKARKQVRAS